MPNLVNPLSELYQAGKLARATILLAGPTLAIETINQFCLDCSIDISDRLLMTEPVDLKVSDARQIRQFVELTGQGPIKLVFLAMADRLTDIAATALLKTLEEPPVNCYFILATTRPDHLLPTIRSRCSVVRLTGEDEFIEPISLPEDLFEAFKVAKELAAGDTPLPTLFAGFINDLADKPKGLKIALNYLPAAQTTVNRRLLLDNFFLDLYNSNQLAKNYHQKD